MHSGGFRISPGKTVEGFKVRVGAILACIHIVSTKHGTLLTEMAPMAIVVYLNARCPVMIFVSLLHPVFSLYQGAFVNTYAYLRLECSLVFKCPESWCS